MGHHAGTVELRSRAPLAAIGCLIGALITIPAAPAQSQFDSEPEPLRVETYGPIGPKETLWAAAKSLAPESRGATTAQMAWALYRANPQAFNGAPGRIKPGAMLTIPDTATIRSVDSKLAYSYVMGTAKPPAQPPTQVAVVPKPVAPAVPVPVPMSADDPLAQFVLNPELAAAIQPAAVADAVPDFRNSRDAKSLPPGDAEARYRALESLEPRYAGDVAFDYQYGSSAYDSGHASEAVFILQRAVSVRPGYSGARMELARAYYTTGDNESSRREFETLKSENPPPEASRAIADYLKAIDRRAASYESQLLGYLEGSSGFDTNANGGPDTQTFLGFTLDSRNQATESSYYGLAAGGLFSYPLAPGWRAVGDARLQHRAYPDATFVDSDLIRAGGGVEWKPGLFILGLAPSLSSVRLDGQDNHRNTSVDASAAYAANERWQLSLNARLAQLRYVDALDQQDADSTLFGLGSQHTWTGAPRVQVTAALTTGQDDPKSAGSQFGRALLGSRTSGSLDFGRGRVLSLAFTFLSSDFDGTFFGKQRDDEQLAATLGLDWGVYRATGWLLRGQLTYVDNSSTVTLYDYDRIDAGLSLRKEFQ